MPWPGGEAEHRIRATRKKMKRATRKVRTQRGVAYGKSSFLMKTMENHHVIAGKINHVNMAMSKFAKHLFTRGYSL